MPKRMQALLIRPEVSEAIVTRFIVLFDVLSPVKVSFMVITSHLKWLTRAILLKIFIKLSDSSGTGP